jgi:hypothetical protein
MPMNTTYLDAIANAGKALITHIGLVNAGGTELSGGGYARQAVTWTSPSGNGLVRPTADRVFTTMAGHVVAGWRGYSASTAGTDYGGASLTQVTFSNAGTYTLLAASTGIDHDAT